MYTVKNLGNNIIYLNYDTHFEMNATFIRPTEFSECYFDSIRDNLFTLQEYMTLYANEHETKTFNYLTAIYGHNIPGFKFIQFYNLYNKNKNTKYELTDMELKLYDDVRSVVTINNFPTKDEIDSCMFRSDPWDKIYVIAACNESKISALDHEIAHAMYYISYYYKKEMDEITANFNDFFKDKIDKRLHEYMYSIEVRPDETQAFCSTESVKALLKRFKITEECDLEHFKSQIKKYKKVYKKHKKLFNIPKNI